MSDMSFTWRGESSDDHGVVVRNLPPVYAPQIRDEVRIIPGRSGSLHLQDGAREEQLMMIEGYLPYTQDGAQVSDIETIKAWLTGVGDLTLSDRPERRYKARIIDALAFSQWVTGFDDRLFAVSFWADPYAYESDPEVITLNGTLTLDNPGTVPADPLIMIRGTGQVILTVGDCTVILDDMANAYPIYIDSDAKVAYRGLEQYPVSITLADGTWPQLGLGATKISWIGNAKVTITPNWRWL